MYMCTVHVLVLCTYTSNLYVHLHTNKNVPIHLYVVHLFIGMCARGKGSLGQHEDTHKTLLTGVCVCA